MSTANAELAQLVCEIEAYGMTPDNARRLGRELAISFGVQEDEIGILRMEGSSLVFCHPAKLQTVGRLPLNSSSSVAVRTANSRRPELINNFTQVKHTTFFEAVDLSRGDSAGDKAQPSSRLIQKIMSVPVFDGQDVRGVIQVSRKGATPAAAGPDFTPEELRRLQAVAASLAKCF